MASDVTIVIADPARVVAIREGASLPGRVMSFTSASLGSAFESIRAYRPKMVAIDAEFAQTPSGTAFVDRIEALAMSGRSVVLLAEDAGRWVTIPRNLAKTLNRAAASAAPIVVVARPEPMNTRRAPRFLVRNSLDVSVEAGTATLVDISVLGAQLVSIPVLRPGQKINVGLPDTGETLNVIAQVAWSTYEKIRIEHEPHYRVGLEFTDAARHALEEYRQRHGADEVVPYRSR